MVCSGGVDESVLWCEEGAVEAADGVVARREEVDAFAGGGEVSDAPLGGAFPLCCAGAHLQVEVAGVESGEGVGFTWFEGRDPANSGIVTEWSFEGEGQLGVE